MQQGGGGEVRQLQNINILEYRPSKFKDYDHGVSALNSLNIQKGSDLEESMF